MSGVRGYNCGIVLFERISGIRVGWTKMFIRVGVYNLLNDII